MSTQYVLFLGQKDQEILFGVCTKRVHTLNPRNVISLSRVIREYFYVIFVRTRTCEDASDRDRGESKQGLLYVAIIDVIYVHTPQLINCPRSIGVDRVRYSPFLFRLHLTNSRGHEPNNLGFRSLFYARLCNTTTTTTIATKRARRRRLLSHICTTSPP